MVEGTGMANLTELKVNSENTKEEFIKLGFVLEFVADDNCDSCNCKICEKLPFTRDDRSLSFSRS